LSAYGLAQPTTSESPNLAPLDPILKFLDQDGKPQEPFEKWLKGKCKAFVDEYSIEWQELALLWELVDKFVEGKQILRRRHRGYGWDVIPMPDSTTGAVREQNKLGFYERILMEKWVSSRTKLIAVAGDDSDQSVGSARAAQVWWDATVELVFSEVFRQLEAKAAHVHGTYARYFYYDESDPDGGYTEQPITEERTYKDGEDSAECLDCGYFGTAGEFDQGSLQPDLGASGDGLLPQAGMDRSSGGSLAGTSGNGGIGNGAPGFGIPADPLSSERGMGMDGGAWAPISDDIRELDSQGLDGISPPTALNDISLLCPSCGSPNVEVIPAPEIPIEVVTGTTKRNLGQLKALSVPYSEIRHEFPVSLENSTWVRWKRRVRIDELKQKWPKLKLPNADAGTRDYGLEYEDAMRRSTAINNASTRGGTQDRDRKGYADFEQWWFLPCVYQDYVFPVDIKTVAGEVIPAGTKAVDLCPNGMYVAKVVGMDAPLQICDENHQWHWVTAPYHIRLFTGLGLGIQDAVEMQRQINVVWGLIFTHIRTSAVPGWLYDKDSIEPDSVRKLGQPQNSIPVALKNRPEGTRIEDLVKQMPPGQIPGHLFPYAAQLDANMQTAAGALVNAGLPGNNNTTATGAQINDNAGNQHNAPEFAIKGEADKRSAMVLFELAKKHQLDPRFIPLKGKRGRQDGIWLSAADFANGQVRFEAVRDSWIPNTKANKQESISKLIMTFGGVEPLMMAQQAMPEFVEDVSEAFGVELAGDQFEPTALISRQRVDQIKQLAPQMAAMAPQYEEMAFLQQLQQDEMLASLSPEEQEMAAQQGMIAPVQNPMDMMGDELAASVKPEVRPEEPAHMLSIKWLQNLLLDDEIKDADDITRAGVCGLIRLHFQKQMEQQAAISALQAAAMPPTPEDDPQSEEGKKEGKAKPPSKTPQQKRTDNARANMGGASAKQGAGMPRQAAPAGM
jgi:hypothetical protein